MFNILEYGKISKIGHQKHEPLEDEQNFLKIQSITSLKVTIKKTKKKSMHKMRHNICNIYFW